LLIQIIVVLLKCWNEPTQPNTTQMENFTTNEANMIKAIANTNVFNAEPGFSDITFENIASIMKELFDMETASAKGVFGSLVKKGMFWTEDCGDFEIVYPAGDLYTQIGWQPVTDDFQIVLK